MNHLHYCGPRTGKNLALGWGFLAAVFPVFALNACGSGLCASAYQVELPSLPSAWSSLLGSPRWRLEWISPDVRGETLEVDGNEGTAIRILEEWTTPVIAYPFWPLKGIPPGLMRPAGALFPFDTAGDRIRLHWRGGVDAILYRELAAQYQEHSSGTPRYPHYFNWPRFRSLLQSPDIDEIVLHDPWSADWKTIALKTAQSGFDRRRIIPMPRKDMAVPVPHEGFWIGASPFADPIYQEPGTDLLLQVCETVDTYLSSSGKLRCTQDAWILMPWE